MLFLAREGIEAQTPGATWSAWRIAQAVQLSLVGLEVTVSQAVTDRDSESGTVTPLGPLASQV